MNYSSVNRILGGSVFSFLRPILSHPNYIPLSKLANRSFGFIFKNLLAPNCLLRLAQSETVFNFASCHGKCQKSTMWQAFKGMGEEETRSAKHNPIGCREVTACKYTNAFAIVPPDYICKTQRAVKCLAVKMIQ